LSPDAFLRLARVFGTPQVQLLREFRDQAHPEISYIESGQRDTLGDGKKIAFGAQWHTDDSYMATPCSSTLLYGQIMPPVGGDTLFSNMYAAYDALADELKARIAKLRAVHTYQSRRNASAVPTRSTEEAKESPAVSHPLLRTHPETGRKAIYINLNRIDSVEGLSIEEARRATRWSTRSAPTPRSRPSSIDTNGAPTTW
jgi:taurine dioxygenase